jgi:tetratricopeptide (TPR) repeat protein
MILAKINGDVDTTVARKYFVSGYPTAVMLGPDGKEVDRIVGYAPPDEYLKMVQDYKAGIGTLNDLLAKAKDSSDRALYFQIADKYKYNGGSDQAAVWFDKVIAAGAPTDSLSGESRMALADLQRRAKKLDDALAAYTQIETEFGGNIFSEQASIWQAIILRQKADTTGAIGAFEKFIEKYPKSEDVEYAKKQIDKLKTPPPPSGN